MGVTGLWRLIEPAGKPVPVETLENKVLAVDISIWLHQMVKGYQDAKGAPIANAHLMGLFQRLCKLLYFRIKPVFVFDGAFPNLKRETITKRQNNKLKYNSESERLKRELALLLSKKTAISSLLGKEISPKKSNKQTENDDNIFKLPALPQQEESESESEDESSSSSSTVDLHSVDMESDKFKNLSAKEKYDLLIELKETRKMNSWGRLHELPKKSDNFSDFQLQRLLKRRKVQECLEETEKEMENSGMSINELESLLNDEGIDTKIESLPTRRIASNNTTRFLLINNVKQALADAKKREKAEVQSTSSDVQTTDFEEVTELKSKRDELEEDLEKAIQMSLECADEANTSAGTSKTDDSWVSYNSDTDYSEDSEEEDGFEAPDMSSAKAYIMQYSDFTDKAIDKMVSHKNKTPKPKSNKPKLNEILEEINKEKSVIIDRLELSSSDDECHEEQSNSEAVELETTQESISSDKDVDATQASVICVGSPDQNVVTLDSGSEDTPVKSSQEEKPTARDKEESDSSDSDFEDVPEISQSSKTVVQLTLNMDDVSGDDIFADVFENKQKEGISNVEETVCDIKLKTISDPVIEHNTVEIDDEDEELQKAIKMSLECTIEDKSDTSPVKTNEIAIDSKESNENHIKDTNATKTVQEKPTINRDKMNTDDNKVPTVDQTKDTSTTKILQEKLITKTQPTLHEVENSESIRKQTEVEDKTNAKEIIPEKTVVSDPVSVERLNNMVEEINTEEQDLMQEKGRLDRVGRNITEQMTKDAQELLQLFGIPYIVAPMEAEAQCAFLESVNLTDGTITDDSDIWLFGGKTVYKNFFNQKKHVLQFLSERIEKSFNLNREQLILLALLVGSDYTLGVTGVGPVTALEILASFPFNKKKLQDDTSKQDQYNQIITGLQEFKKWVRAGKRTDNTTLKKKLRNVDLNDDFPSVRVVQAYLEPNVEKSEDKFTWGEIDVNILRDYTKKKFGWSQHKLDEIMKPVIKRLSERKTQKSVQDYFKRKVDVQNLEEQMSKRVKAAVQKMGVDGVVEEQAVEAEKPQRKRKVKEKGIRAEIAGPSKSKQKKTDDDVLNDHCVKVVSVVKDGKSDIEIKIRKTDRYQEVIPQREKDKQSLLQNKMKAIEVFRKTNIDKKKKVVKRKAIIPKPDAELSESSDSN